MKSADGLVDLLYNLLNWAQLQTGRMPFKPVLFDLAADLRETTSTLLNSMAEHKNIKLTTELPDTALVTADINMIKTVVRNLVDNAIKFTPTGGNVTLTISPHPSSLTPQTPNPKPQTSSLTPQTPYRISVTDTGVGMNETQIRNLFNRDVTRHASTKGTANESGTGLGLMVCKELLEKHGSMLHVESEEGKGSAFWFELSCR
jgi:signal transduction histidine kinase